LITRRSEKQSTIACSSYELEWLCYLLADSTVVYSKLPILYCDNKSTLCIAANSNFHEWTKHFEIDCHLSRGGMRKAFCLPHEELLS
jgi:hypothetical protein